MKKLKVKFKFEKGSILILVVMGLLPLLIAILDKFGVINLYAQISSLLVLLGSGFIINEQVRKHKKALFKNTGSVVLIVLVLVGIVGSVLSLLGVNVPILQTFEGIILSVVLLGSVIELFN